MMLRWTTSCAVGVSAMAAIAGSALARQFEISRVPAIVVDGRDDDWKSGTFEVAAMSRIGHVGVKCEPSGEADLRLGWDEKGLVLFVKVWDEQRQEPGAIHRGDSIEVFVASQVGAPDYLQVLVAPGISGSKSDKPRVLVAGYGKLKGTKAPVEVAGGPDKSGYQLELRIPLADLGDAMGEGRELGFQFLVNDRDIPYAQIGNYTRANSQIDHICWFPNRNTYANPAQMVKLVLAQKPGDSVLVAVQPEFAAAQPRLTVKTLQQYAGRRLTVTQAGKELGSTLLVAEPAARLSGATLTLDSLQKSGSPLELRADAERIATIPLYQELKDQQKPIVGEMLRTADEKRRLELVRQLEASTTDKELKEDIGSLLAVVEIWADGRQMAEAGRLADPTQYLSSSVDPMGPPAVRADSPVYPLYCLYRARNLIWRAIQGGEPEDIEIYYALARKLLQEAQAVVPDNPIVNMYLGRQIAWPGPANDSNAPAWANAQRQSLEKLAEIIHWWADERQMPSGSYGGGWNDDVEMWRNWWPVMLAFADPKAEQAQRKLSTAIFAQEHMKAGYSAIMDDVEHSAEDSADTITPMLYLDPLDKEWSGRSLSIARIMRDVWTAKDQKGRMMFRNILFNASATGKDPKNAYDTTLSSRAVQPALVYWHRTHDPALTGQFTAWLDTWVQATAEARNGKPAGIMPTVIHWPDGRIGGQGGKWWDAEGHSTLYNWPWYVSDMLHVMLMAYEVTGQDRYLEPIRSMARVRADYLARHPGEAQQTADSTAFAAFGRRGAKGESDGGPEAGSLDWVASQLGPLLPGPLMAYRNVTGDRQFDGILRHDGDAHLRYLLDGDVAVLTRQLESVAQAFSSNREGYTSEVRWTDRLFRLTAAYLNSFEDKPLPLPNTRLVYAAATGDPATWVGGRMAAVRWHTPPKDIAALVTRPGRTSFEAELYNFSPQAREMDAELLLLSKGRYKVTFSAREAAGGAPLMQRSLDVGTVPSLVHVALPSRRLCVLSVVPE